MHHINRSSGFRWLSPPYYNDRYFCALSGPKRVVMFKSVGMGRFQHFSYECLNGLLCRVSFSNIVSIFLESIFSGWSFSITWILLNLTNPKRYVSYFHISRGFPFLFYNKFDFGLVAWNIYNSNFICKNRAKLIRYRIFISISIG